MGQKVSPIGFRTGVTIGWKSRWFAPKATFGEFVVEDEHIRRFIDQRLNRQPPYAAISNVEIERTREEVRIIISAARPGLVIGPKGAEVEKLRAALEDLTDRRVNINIVEVRNPDLDAQLIADSIAEQLKRRAGFRRVIRQRAESATQAGAKGVKIIISGRLGGAEIARSESVIEGSIPLHTLEANVDYGRATSFTTYGTVGVKVWVYKGMFAEQQSDEEIERQSAMTRARRRRQRKGTGSGGQPRGRRSSAQTRQRSAAKASEPSQEPKDRKEPENTPPEQPQSDAQQARAGEQTQQPQPVQEPPAQEQPAEESAGDRTQQQQQQDTDNKK